MFIKDWKNMFSSMLYFLKLIFVRKDYDVTFVSSAYFNRGDRGENLLLKPMINSCKKHKLKYIVYEDTDLKGLYDNFNRSSEALPFDFISLIQIILRKFFNLFFIKPESESELYKREYKISKIIKRLFFNKFRSDVYITLLFNNAFFASISIISPLRKSPIGPPTEASGPTCPMQKPLVAPENLPSVMRATFLTILMNIYIWIFIEEILFY